jgi:hypothetical protein
MEWKDQLARILEQLWSSNLGSSKDCHHRLRIDAVIIDRMVV